MVAFASVLSVNSCVSSGGVFVGDRELQSVLEKREFEWRDKLKRSRES